VASCFHFSVTFVWHSYKRVKGRSHTVGKRKASHPQKPHATCIWALGMQSNARAKAGCLQRASAAHLYIILKDKVRVEALNRESATEGSAAVWMERVVLGVKVSWLLVVGALAFGCSRCAHALYTRSTQIFDNATCSVLLRWDVSVADDLHVEIAKEWSCIWPVWGMCMHTCCLSYARF